MVDADIISAKLAEVTDRLQRVRARCPSDAATLAADRDALDVVSFNLVLAIQAAIDTASHLIADEGWRPAGTLGESFVRLAEQEVLTRRTAEALAAAAGMRNILVHVYSRVDPLQVHRAASVDLAHLENFTREVAEWTTRRLAENQDSG